MEIKSITMTETGKGVFRCEHGLVETVDGQKYVYTLEYNIATWTDRDDYFDNIKSDFLNEYEDNNEFGTDDMGLFIRKDIWEL